MPSYPRDQCARPAPEPRHSGIPVGASVLDTPALHGAQACRMPPAEEPGYTPAPRPGRGRLSPCAAAIAPTLLRPLPGLRSLDSPGGPASPGPTGRPATRRGRGKPPVPPGSCAPDPEPVGASAASGVRHSPPGGASPQPGRPTPCSSRWRAVSRRRGGRPPEVPRSTTSPSALGAPQGLAEGEHHSVAVSNHQLALSVDPVFRSVHVGAASAQLRHQRIQPAHPELDIVLIRASIGSDRR